MDKIRHINATFLCAAASQLIPIIVDGFAGHPVAGQHAIISQRMASAIKLQPEGVAPQLVSNRAQYQAVIKRIHLIFQVAYYRIRRNDRVLVPQHLLEKMHPVE